MQYAVLAPFFIVHNKLHGDTGACRPLRGRRSLTVTDEISWIGFVASHAEKVLSDFPGFVRLEY